MRRLTMWLRRSAGGVALAAAMLVAGAAGAHHGWGSYDAERPLTVEGRIAEVAYGNPHVEIVVEADGTRW